MLRWFFIALLVLHGCIHLLGFVKAFGLAEVDQLEQPISKPIGLVWLLTTLVFLLTALAYSAGWSWWWVAGLIGVVISQFAIIEVWTDARWGTLPNLITLVVCLVGAGAWQFERMAKAEVTHLLSPPQEAGTNLEEADLAVLPSPVQRWLRHVRAVGTASPAQVRLHQRGRMRLGPNRKWLTVDARQWFNLIDPAFIWHAHVGTGSLVQFGGRDRYAGGRGQMLIKLYHLFPVIRAEGPQIDQGTAVRYLAEMAWFPTVAIKDYIEWKALDDQRAMATLREGPATVQATFTFDKAGKLIRIEAPRYYEQTGEMKNWIIELPTEGYRTFEGLRLPAIAFVGWELDQGIFTWYELEITKLDYSF